MIAGLVYLAVAALSVAAGFVLNPFRQTRAIDVVLLALASAFLGAVPLASVLLVDDATPIFAVATIGPPLFAAAVLWRRRRLHWQVRSVFDPRFGEQGLASLRAHLSKKRPLPHLQDARRAAWVLAHEGLLEDAVTVLADVPISEVSSRWAYERAVYGNDLAAYRIRLGDLDGARSAIASIAKRPRFAVPILATKEALLAALDGDPDEALAIVEGTTLPARSPHRATLEMARAHAQAAKGDADAAREILRGLAERDPEEWLARATTPSGPATPIATALAAEQAAPYR